MEEGFFAHVREGEGFAYEVGDLITELVVTSHNEAVLLIFQCMT